MKKSRFNIYLILALHASCMSLANENDEDLYLTEITPEERTLYDLGLATDLHMIESYYVCDIGKSNCLLISMFEQTLSNDHNKLTLFAPFYHKSQPLEAKQWVYFDGSVRFTKTFESGCLLSSDWHETKKIFSKDSPSLNHVWRVALRSGNSAHIRDERIDPIAIEPLYTDGDYCYYMTFQKKEKNTQQIYHIQNNCIYLSCEGNILYHFPAIRLNGDYSITEDVDKIHASFKHDAYEVMLNFIFSYQDNDGHTWILSWKKIHKTKKKLMMLEFDEINDWVWYCQDQYLKMRGIKPMK